MIFFIGLFFCLERSAPRESHTEPLNVHPVFPASLMILDGSLQRFFNIEIIGFRSSVVLYRVATLKERRCVNLYGFPRGWQEISSECGPCVWPRSSPMRSILSLGGIEDDGWFSSSFSECSSSAEGLHSTSVSRLTFVRG